MMTGHGDSKPYEWEQWVRQPVLPTQVADSRAVGSGIIEPDIKKLIGTQSGNIVDSEAVGPEELPTDVVVTLEGCDAPAQRSIGNQLVRAGMPDAQILPGHAFFRSLAMSFTLAAGPWALFRASQRKVLLDASQDA